MTLPFKYSKYEDKLNTHRVQRIPLVVQRCITTNVAMQWYPLYDIRRQRNCEDLLVIRLSLNFGSIYTPRHRTLRG
jgi:hypothetical protein